LTLGELIALMEESHAFIGNDSGAMHLAAAMGVPVTAIFGASDWKTTPPYVASERPYARIVRHAVDCSPCMKRNCPIDHPCMKGVEVDDVARSFAELNGPIRERMARYPVRNSVAGIA
jgi:heptosyltransferase-2